MNDSNKKNIRLELVANTFHFLVQMQNLMRRKAGKKVSFQKLILYYFFKGVSLNLKRKQDFVQKFIQNDQNLAELNAELTIIDQSIDQFRDDTAAALNGLSEKDYLLQRDLINQFHLLQSKELRLIKKEENLTRLEQKSTMQLQEVNDLKMQLLLKNAELELKTSELNSCKQWFDSTYDKLKVCQSEIAALRNEKIERRSNFRELKKLLEKVKQNTDELLRSEKSWFNQVLKFALPVLAYFGAKAGSNKKSDSPDTASLMKEIKEISKELTVLSKVPS